MAHAHDKKKTDKRKHGKARTDKWENMPAFPTGKGPGGTGSRDGEGSERLVIRIAGKKKRTNHTMEPTGGREKECLVKAAKGRGRGRSEGSFD